MRQQRKERIAMKVSVNSILVNLILSAFKLFAGIAARSGAMISDAAHSASDVFSTVIVMAGVVLASREADENISTATNGWNVWRRSYWEQCCASQGFS